MSISFYNDDDQGTAYMSFCTSQSTKRLIAHCADHLGMSVSKFCSESLKAIVSLPIVIHLREEMQRTGESLSTCIEDMYMTPLILHENDADARELAWKKLDLQREALEQRRAELDKQFEALEQKRQTLAGSESQA